VEKMTKKFLALGLVAIMAAGVLVGCGTNPNSINDSTVKENEAVEATNGNDDSIEQIGESSEEEEGAEAMNEEFVRKGTIISVTKEESGVLLKIAEREFGHIVLIRMDGEESFEPGNYVEIETTGIETRSIPPQMTGKAVLSKIPYLHEDNVRKGIVDDVQKDETGAFLTVTHPAMGFKTVIYVEGDTQFDLGHYVEIETTGISTMTQPAQMLGKKVLLHSKDAQVSKTFEDITCRYFKIEENQLHVMMGDVAQKFDIKDPYMFEGMEEGTDLMITLDILGDGNKVVVKALPHEQYAVIDGFANRMMNFKGVVVSVSDGILELKSETETQKFEIQKGKIFEGLVEGANVKIQYARNFDADGNEVNRILSIGIE